MDLGKALNTLKHNPLNVSCFSNEVKYIDSILKHRDKNVVTSAKEYLLKTKEYSFLIDLMIHILYNQYTHLLGFASSILVNLSYSDSAFVRYMIDKKCIFLFFNIITVWYGEEMADDAMQSLSNIIADESIKSFEEIQQMGLYTFLEIQLKMVQQNPVSRKFLENLLFGFENLTYPPFKSEFYKKLPNILNDLVLLLRQTTDTDRKTKNSILRILSNITSNDQIQLLMDQNVVPILIVRCNELLEQHREKSHEMLMIIRIFGNIVSGTTEQTQKMIDYGITFVLKRLLHLNITEDLQIAILFAISNICRGNEKQFEEVFDLISEVTDLFFASFELKNGSLIQNEIAEIFVGCLGDEKPMYQIHEIMKETHGVALKSLLFYLKNLQNLHQEKRVVECLEALKHLLLTKENKEYGIFFINLSGMEILSSLSQSKIDSEPCFALLEEICHHCNTIFADD